MKENLEHKKENISINNLSQKELIFYNKLQKKVEKLDQKNFKKNKANEKNKELKLKKSLKNQNNNKSVNINKKRIVKVKKTENPRIILDANFKLSKDLENSKILVDQLVKEKKSLEEKLNKSTFSEKSELSEKNGLKIKSNLNDKIFSKEKNLFMSKKEEFNNSKNISDRKKNSIKNKNTFLNKNINLKKLISDEKNKIINLDKRTSQKYDSFSALVGNLNLNSWLIEQSFNNNKTKSLRKNKDFILFKNKIREIREEISLNSKKLKLENPLETSSETKENFIFEQKKENYTASYNDLNISKNSSRDTKKIIPFGESDLVISSSDFLFDTNEIEKNILDKELMDSIIEKKSFRSNFKLKIIEKRNRKKLEKNISKVSKKEILRKINSKELKKRSEIKYDIYANKFTENERKKKINAHIDSKINIDLENYKNPNYSSDNLSNDVNEISKQEILKNLNLIESSNNYENKNSSTTYDSIYNEEFKRKSFERRNKKGDAENLVVRNYQKNIESISSEKDIRKKIRRLDVQSNNIEYYKNPDLEDHKIFPSLEEEIIKSDQNKKNLKKKNNIKEYNSSQKKNLNLFEKTLSPDKDKIVNKKEKEIKIQDLINSKEQKLKIGEYFFKKVIEEKEKESKKDEKSDEKRSLKNLLLYYNIEDKKIRNLFKKNNSNDRSYEERNREWLSDFSAEVNAKILNKKKPTGKIGLTKSGFFVGEQLIINREKNSKNKGKNKRKWFFFKK